MKKAVVTGAGGFIGRALVHRLVELGYQVYAVIFSENDKERFPNDGTIVPVIGDLLAYEKIEEQIQSPVDYVYHLAWKGISSADYKDIDVQKDNFFISINTCKLALALESKKFIFAGSNQEYLLDINTIDEKEACSSIYGICKFSCRKICSVLAKNKMQFNATAFTNVFGVGDKSRRTANFFISKLLKDEDLDLVEGNHLYDWIYIDDAVNGLIAVGEKGVNNQQYYIGNRHLRTFKEIIENVKDILSSQSNLNFGKYQDTSYTDYSRFDLNALHRDTGFECKSNFEESILTTAEWVKTLNF